MDCSQSASQACTLSWTWLESNSCSIGSIQFLWVVEAGSCFPPGFQLAATLRPLPWVYFLPQRQQISCNVIIPCHIWFLSYKNITVYVHPQGISQWKIAHWGGRDHEALSSSGPHTVPSSWDIYSAVFFWKGFSKDKPYSTVQNYVVCEIS